MLWSQSKEDALYLADVIALATEKTELFVIGGEQMYKLFGQLCNRIHLTQIFARLTPRADDAIFDFDADGRQWKTLHEEEVPNGPYDEFPSRYTILDRKFKTVRYVELEDFYTDVGDKRRWLASQVEIIKKTIAQGEQPHAPKQLHMFEEKENISNSA